MKESYKKLPIAAGIAGALLIPLVAACGGKGEGQDNQGEHPTPQATATLIVPTVEATSTVELKCTPEIQKAVEKLDKIIYEIENPDQWVREFFSPPVLDVINSNIFYADPEHSGLKDLRNVLINCEVEQAMEIMTASIGEKYSYNFAAIVGLWPSSRDPATQVREPSIKWSEEEIQKYDPQRIFIQGIHKAVTVPIAREQAVIGFLELYYYLDSLPEGGE